MPITVQCDDARRLRTVTLTGPVNFTDVRQFIATRSLGHLVGPYDLLVDLRDANLAFLSSNDMHQLASLAGHRFPAERYRRVAIVAPSDETFGTARMYATHRETTGLVARVFRSFEAAQSWLSEGT